MMRTNLLLSGIIIMVAISSGCFSSDKGGNNEKVECTIENSTDDPVGVEIQVTKNGKLIYNNSVMVLPSDNVVITEFDQGFGTYHFYLFIDDGRILDKDISITKTQYPPKFTVTADEIEYSQKEV